MKIAVYAISLNEEMHVERFCNSARAADLIFVADTGSTDRTVELLKSHGAQVTNIRIKPWRFDHARMTALSLLPDDIDVCVSLDLDEELQPGWREEIERVWKPETTRLRYGFDWGCGIVFQYEKIHGRHGYIWWHPAHEYPRPDRIQEVWAHTDMLMVIHKPDPTKSRGQYLDILRVSIEEDPFCPRNAFYYARELSFHRHWQQSIDECKRYLLLPRATWPNERCYALRTMGRCYQELGQWDEALKAFRLACNEAPNTREPWHELAKCCYSTHRWAESLGAALTCLSVTQREWVYTVDPEVWGWSPHDLASIAAYNLGLYDLAEKQALKAVEIAPDDVRLRQNLDFCQQKVKAA